MKEHERIPVGTEVMIRRDSEHWNEPKDNPYNPGDTAGVVTNNNQKSREGYIYHVDWSNGKGNNYRHEDLELAVKEPVVTNTYPIY